MTAAGSKRLPDAKIPLEPKNKVTVVGHKFSQRDVSTTVKKMFLADNYTYLKSRTHSYKKEEVHF